MANEPEEGRPLLDADEGGPVKSFLDHLEDLRWVLVKSAAAIAVAMLICLIAAPQVVGLIKRPLDQAKVSYPGEDKIAVLMFGTNHLNTFHLTLDQWDTINLRTNHDATRISLEELVELGPIATRLKEPDKTDLLSQCLTNQLSKATWQMLTNYDEGTNAALQQALVDDLNRVMRAGPLYDKQRFEKITLSPDTALLAASNPQGDDLAKLNRRLLLHAYPWSISRNANRFIAVTVEPRNTDGREILLGLRIDTSVDPEKLAKQLHVDLNTLSPAGGFMVAFQVAMYGGIAIASPLILLFIAQFVFPALKMRERKYVYRGVFYAVPLFLIGASFCYFILMPVALSASQMYSNWLGFSASMWRAEDYISFVCKFMLGMGLGFEMPVVILVLVKIGILNYRILSKARRYMIVINLILGALLTTPEVLTQVLMALPLQLLYEITVWIAWYWEKKEEWRDQPAARARFRRKLLMVILIIALVIGGVRAGFILYKAKKADAKKARATQPIQNAVTNGTGATTTNVPTK